MRTRHFTELFNLMRHLGLVRRTRFIGLSAMGQEEHLVCVIADTQEKHINH